MSPKQRWEAVTDPVFERAVAFDIEWPRASTITLIEPFYRMSWAGLHASINGEIEDT